ncbi:MAG: class I SAM-dependent methyltransferase [Dehalococcoidia bacterium]|nr:class I SAM-dependent methyltransferase [Dehalococcoidia bacterium]
MSERLFAWCYALVDGAQRRQTAALRRALLDGVAGAVIEVGCGPGANFAHYPPGVCVIATDRNPHMLARARREAARARATIEVRPADAGALPAADGACDVYVATLVLCSVPDLDAAVAEAWRVLRPGGAALLLEHVRSTAPRIARLQGRLNPLWSALADGCQLDRDPAAALRARGFAVSTVAESRRVGGLLPIVALRARKPA